MNPSEILRWQEALEIYITDHFLQYGVSYSDSVWECHSPLSSGYLVMSGSGSIHTWHLHHEDGTVSYHIDIDSYGYLDMREDVEATIKQLLLALIFKDNENLVSCAVLCPRDQ